MCKRLLYFVEQWCTTYDPVRFALQSPYCSMLLRCVIPPNLCFVKEGGIEVDKAQSLESVVLRAVESPGQI